MTNEHLSTIELETGLIRKEHGNSVGLDEIERAARELARTTVDAGSYDELKKLQNVTSELWQAAERERDELERLAGDANEAFALVCDELSQSMPDDPQEFNAENIWGAVKSAEKAGAALSKCLVERARPTSAKDLCPHLGCYLRTSNGCTRDTCPLRLTTYKRKGE